MGVTYYNHSSVVVRMEERKGGQETRRRCIAGTWYPNSESYSEWGAQKRVGWLSNLGYDQWAGRGTKLGSSGGRTILEVVRREEGVLNLFFFFSWWAWSYLVEILEAFCKPKPRTQRRSMGWEHRCRIIGMEIYRTPLELNLGCSLPFDSLDPSFFLWSLCLSFQSANLWLIIKLPFPKLTFLKFTAWLDFTWWFFLNYKNTTC